jgi:hypothetical protein
MRIRSLLAAPIAMLALAFVPSVGHAEPGSPLSGFTARMVDSAGDPENRAGVSPDRFQVSLALDLAAGNAKHVAFELAPGFVGATNAVPSCPRHLISFFDFSVTCPSATQVGEIETEVLGGPSVLALYNIDPEPGYVAEFGFKSLLFDGRIYVKMLPNGQARFEMRDLIQDSAVPTLDVEIWGIPADHQTAPTAPRRPLLKMGTRCDGTAPQIKLEVRSWQAPETTHVSWGDFAPPLVGCEDLEIDPRLGFTLDDATTDSPTGVRIDLDMADEADPDAEPTGRLRNILIGFPEGLALSPSAAHGLTACSEQAARIGQPGPAGCAASSRIGATELSSPLLKEPVAGAVYIGRQLSDTEYRMYVVMNEKGIDIELGGILRADPATGRLTAEIEDVPELDVGRLTLSFRGGPRGMFATPQDCGSGTASIVVTPYGGGAPVTALAPVATSSDPFGRPCPAPQPFAPDFVAGTSSTRAGAKAPLAVTIRRASGERMLERFTMKLPPGVSASLGPVRRCAAAAVSAGACPRESRIGAAFVETGSGTSPFLLEGDVFLTGPYRRAPFGVVLVFRALAGPFDLGTVVIRAALRVDPLTGQVSVETDSFPRMLKGVPLRIQTVAMDLDRPGFMTNPTSCAASAATARMESVDGSVSNGRSRFAVGGCRALRFRPTLSMTLTEREQLHAGGYPGLRLRLRSPSRDANLSDLSFDLPPLVGPSVTGPTAICSRRQLANERCPAEASVGKVSARTAVLSEPLRGNLYSVQPPRGGVPDVWAVMRGEGVGVRFRLKSKLVGGRLRGELVDLPDIPLASLTMKFAGGKRGLFTLDRAPCVGGRARRAAAKARLTAHSSATRRATVPLRVASSSCR